ncbi:MAG: ATPase, T2SS/T4P/T4SS family [Clostridiales bacterium]
MAPGQNYSGKKRIGQTLVEFGFLSMDNLNKALAKQKDSGKKIGELLVSEGYITETDLLQVLEFQLGIPHVKLEQFKIDKATCFLVPESFARRHKVIPISEKNGVLTLAMYDPLNMIAIDDIKLFTGMEIQPVISTLEDINNAIDKNYTTKKAREAVEDFRKENVKNIIVKSDEEEETADIDSPIVRLVNSIIEEAAREKASDIHIEPLEDCLRVRYRKDGQLFEAMRPEIELLTALSTRIKVISNLNIAEKRLPQDGRVTVSIDGKDIDLRIAISPTIHGEQIVIRVSDKNAFVVPKEKLGFTKEDADKFEKILKNPHGILLVTGPTGSGKTTTLYSALNEINNANIKIITIEDPVECYIDGVNHIQANYKSGLTFSVGLRSILRLDPDVIMIGEIRDNETAEIAVRSAITGHLVISTLHTNDAPSTITRLIDMGIQPFMVASSVVGVISQRLIKKICSNCKISYKSTEEELEILKLSMDTDLTLYKGRGCNICSGSGYKGRMGVYEIMTITKKHKEIISRNCNESELMDLSRENGMITLNENARRCVLEGITTVEEMMRISYSND